jgi:hypothetical protein
MQLVGTVIGISSDDQYAVKMCVIVKVYFLEKQKLCLFCGGTKVFFLGAFAKLRKVTVSFVMSVCLHLPSHPRGTTWLPLDGFS